MNALRGIVNGIIAGVIAWSVLIVALFYGFRITL